MLPQSSVIQLVEVYTNVIRRKNCDTDACKLQLFQRLHSTENVSQRKPRNTLLDFPLIFPAGRS